MGKTPRKYQHITFVTHETKSLKLLHQQEAVLLHCQTGPPASKRLQLCQRHKCKRKKKKKQHKINKIRRGKKACSINVTEEILHLSN